MLKSRSQLVQEVINQTSARSTDEAVEKALVAFTSHRKTVTKLENEIRTLRGALHSIQVESERLALTLRGLQRAFQRTQPRRGREIV